MENVRTISRRWGVLLALLGWAEMGWAQIRIVNYNVLEQVRPGMTEIFTAIGGSARGGFAQPPDIVLLQESRGASTTAEEFKNMLNEIYGAGVYGRGILTGSSTGSGGPSVVYRTNKVTLVAEVQVNNTSTSGAARSTLRYQFRPVGYDSAADFYVYNSHFKASSDSTSRNRRGIEAGEIRANADALGEGMRAIYSGDFNLYSSSEPGFQNFVAAGVGQAFDPVDRVGSWSNAGSFRDVHTQSPVTVARFGNQVTGGMDDRFDFQLVTGPLMSGRGFAYLPGSYWAFGNTGTHQMDGEITTGSALVLQSYLPGYTEAQATAVLTALAESSDHLPVVADYQLPAKMAVTVEPPPARILRGAAVSLPASVSNAAEVTVPAGADRLDFSWSGSGSLTGSGSGTAQPLGPAQGASPVWDTSAAGAKTGTLTITAESPQAFPASFSTNLTTMVLEPAGASFDGGTTTNALTVDLGTVAMGAAAPSAMFRVYNRASSSGPALTSDLDVDGVNAPAGGASPMSVTLATGRVTAGGSVQGTVNLATATPGTYERVFTVQVSDENVPGEGSQTLVLTVQGKVTAAQSALESWATGYGLSGTNAEATADPDGDGYVNLAEYALGGNPTLATGGLGPTVSMTNTNGTNWLRFAYRARTNDGVLVIQPVFKVNLTETNWSTNGVVQKVSGQPAGDGVHEDQVWQTPVGVESRRFLRLQISR